MELLDFLTPSDEISANGGPEDHVVLSSRVRLARNISGVPFPGPGQESQPRGIVRSDPSVRLRGFGHARGILQWHGRPEGAG